MPKEIQVLFLDDEESIIDGIQRLFIREPYEVFATTKVADARAALAKYKIKTVVSDYRMPDISGIQFLREVKEQYPDTVKILFTGYTDFSAAEEAINVGEVYRFISKPWKTAELLSTIRQCVEMPRSSRSMPPSNLLAPALVRRWAPLASTLTRPCSRARSVRICDVSLNSTLRRQMDKSDARGILGLYEARIESSQLRQIPKVHIVDGSPSS